MTTILVTGATGTVGSQLIRRLRHSRVSVRALVRDPQSARALLGDDVTLVPGDLADPASLRRATQGVDRLFLACGNRPDQVDLEVAALDAARDACVRRVVKLSALGAEIGSSVAFWDVHARIEEHLASTGLPAVVLRPAFLMTNLLASAEAVRATGRLFLPAGEARVAMVDPRDVALVAASALTGDRHVDQTLTLTGPVALTFAEVAAELSRATGSDIGYVPVPDDDARAAMAAQGVPAAVAEVIVEIFRRLRGGVAEHPTGDVERTTGVAARTFADFARDHASVFAPVPTPASAATG